MPLLRPRYGPRILGGVNDTTSAADVPTTGWRSGNVTFPAGFFTVAPTVVATPAGTGSWEARVMVRGVSTSGFTFDVPYSGGQTGVRWLAVQP